LAICQLSELIKIRVKIFIDFQLNTKLPSKISSANLLFVAGLPLSLRPQNVGAPGDSPGQLSKNETLNASHKDRLNNE
jgi:hypothetical protein